MPMPHKCMKAGLKILCRGFNLYMVRRYMIKGDGMRMPIPANAHASRMLKIVDMLMSPAWVAFTDSVQHMYFILYTGTQPFFSNDA